MYSKYQKNIVLFLAIIFLSQFIFAYDEEKVVALCLISFATIVYFNFNQIIFNSLNTQSLEIEKEFSILYKEKKILMRKLWSVWRIFLDIEDFIVEIYYWVKKSLIYVLEQKKKNRKLFSMLLLKYNINQLYLYQMKINENLKYFLLILFKFSLNNINKKKYFKTNLNILKKINKFSFKHILLSKLNNNTFLKAKNYHYNTYLYIKW